MVLGMQGLSVQGLRHHRSLIPLLVSIGGGAILAGAYLLRLAIQNPDASFNRKGNPHPWQNMKPSTQYKFYSEKIDYRNLKQPAERPDI